MNFTFHDVFPIDKIYISSLIFYVINWIFLIWFSYVNYKRHGIFSFTFIWMFFSFFLGIQFSFFFAYSDLNYISSPDIYLFSHLVNDTFLISSIGFYSFIGGVLLSNKISFMPLGLSFTYKSIYGFVKHRWTKIFLFFIVLLGVLILLILNVPFGQARSFAMENHSIRPIINLFIALYAFLFFLIWIIAVYSKKVFYYIFFIILLILNLWSGTRATLLIPIIYMIASLSIVNRNKNLLKYSMCAICVLFLAFFIKAIRDSADNISLEMIIWEFLFGNSFSDLRDFSWIYYYWDFHSDFLLGKTYLSGIMSFIPSYISEFRELWSWGRWSTDITYLNSSVHPGLRPGPFGEMFFNFGYFGVILLGTTLGLCIGRLDKILLNIRNSDISKKELFLIVSVFFVYYGLISAIVISAGYFNLYLKIFILLIGYISIKIK